MFLVFVVPLTARYPLLDPAEGLHASISQAMVESGDWSHPHLRGEAFLDKPILFFWCQAASLSCLGMTEQAARLPGLVFGFLGVFTTALIGCRMFDRPTGLLAGMFYATLLFPAVMAQSGAHDVAMLPWVNLAILFYWEIEQGCDLRRQQGLLLLVGVSLGIACLMKGLVGIAVVGTVYGSYLIAGGAWRKAGWRRLCLTASLTLGLAALLAAPWYLLMEVYRPGYLRYFFIDRHVFGFATDTQMHSNQPWWYYLPVVFLGGLPWIGYLPHAIQETWALRNVENAARERGAYTLLWCWLVVTFLLFTAAQSKTAAYILPVFPPIAVLSASVWIRLIDGRLGDSARRGLARTFRLSLPVAMASLPVILAVLHYCFAVPVSPPHWILAVVIALMPLTMVISWSRRRFAEVLAVGTLFTAAELLFVLFFLVPSVALRFSARELANEFNRRGRVPREVLLGDEHLGSIIFYLKPELRANLKPGQVRKIFLQLEPDTWNAAPGAALVVSKRRLAEGSIPLPLEDMPSREFPKHRLWEYDSWSPGIAAPPRRTPLR